MKADLLLPLLISVPHGGINIPMEAEACCRLDIPAILRDGDTWSPQLYDLGALALEYFCFPVPRAVVDVNRAPDDLPPHNPDGVVKTITVEAEAVWIKNETLSTDFVKLLLTKYYFPYHAQLTRGAKNRQIVLGLDCHTMLDRAPGLSANPGEQRPMICLSNRGDERGEQQEDQLTAPPSLMRSLKKSLQCWFSDLRWDKSIPVVTLNRPFKGGYITRKHSLDSGFPWIQIEINRALYISEPFSQSPVPDEETLQRLKEIRRRLTGALVELVRSQSVKNLREDILKNRSEFNAGS